jgi:ubiquinone/menaquinone biosynthesis C-methylase UbiE
VETSLVCPGCRGALLERADGLVCLGGCGEFPVVAGLPDLRLESDRYLDLEAERAKAGRLHALEGAADLRGLAEAYYAMTDDVVDARRARFLRHIQGAEARGEALAARLPHTGRILEIGCGTGGLLAAALRSGRAIAGVDIAARWLVVARRRLADRGLAAPLVAAAAERLPWPDASFDTIVADSLLEHLDDPARALAEWVRVLRPGGRLVVWSPNRFTLTTDPHTGLWGIGWLPRAWVPAYLRLRGRPVWPPRTLSPQGARRLAEAAGLVEVEVDSPDVPEAWARSLPPPQRLALRAYRGARRAWATRSLVRALGPLWELRATTAGGVS